METKLSRVLILGAALGVAVSMLCLSACRGTEVEDESTEAYLLVRVVDSGGEPLSADTVFWWHPVDPGPGAVGGLPETHPGIRSDSTGTRWMLLPDTGTIVVRTVHYQQTATQCMSSGNSMDTLRAGFVPDTVVVALSPILVCP